MFFNSVLILYKLLHYVQYNQNQNLKYLILDFYLDGIKRVFFFLILSYTIMNLIFFINQYIF